MNLDINSLIQSSDLEHIDSCPSGVYLVIHTDEHFVTLKGCHTNDIYRLSVIFLKDEVNVGDCVVRNENLIVEKAEYGYNVA